jgi:hypothetical protein
MRYAQWGRLANVYSSFRGMSTAMPISVGGFRGARSASRARAHAARQVQSTERIRYVLSPGWLVCQGSICRFRGGLFRLGVCDCCFLNSTCAKLYGDSEIDSIEILDGAYALVRICVRNQVLRSLSSIQFSSKLAVATSLCSSQISCASRMKLVS